MAAAHDHADDHDDHAHGGHDHDDHGHGHDEAVEEDSVRTPMWLPFVGIVLLLFGAVYTYSVMHEPPAPTAAASAEASASAGEGGGSAAPAAPAPAH